jgi:hypothetical protein
MNCLQRAMNAAKGKLTESEVKAAMDQEQQIRKALIDAGKDNVDERVANRIAQLAMDKKIEAARMKRAIAVNIKTEIKLTRHLGRLQSEGGVSPAVALRLSWEGTQLNVTGARASGYAQAQAFEKAWFGSIMSKLEAERPHIKKLFTNKKFDDAVTDELHELRDGGEPGKTGNSDAQFLARLLAAHMEIVRNKLNDYGAGIGKVDGYAGPQVHDDLTMLSVSREQWANDIKPLLDLKRTFPDATSDAEVDSALHDIFSTIITGVSNRDSPLLRGEVVRPAGLVNRLGKSRVLHFKDSLSSRSYRDLYGRGSTIQGIFAQMKNQAHMAGALATYGTNPKNMILKIAERMRKDLKTKSDGMAPSKAKDALVQQMTDLTAHDGEISRLKGTIEAITGLSGKPESVRMATIGTSIRTVQSLAKLGGAAITAMPADTITMGSAAMFRGQGFWNGLLKTMGEIKNHKNSKEIGFLTGEGFDAITGHLGSHANDGPAGTLSKISQTFYKWSGLSGWTDTARAISGRVIAAHLGLNMKTAFSGLDERLAHVLRLNGIDSAKWDAIRSVGSREENGQHYITPDLIRNASDDVIRPIIRDQIAALTAAAKKTELGQAKLNERVASLVKTAREDLEMDLHRYYADETNYGVLQGDAASRRISTLGTRPGTVAGESIRFIMQFKGFPIAFGQRILGRAIHNAPTGRAGQAAHIGTLMAGLTAAGYMSMTMKDLVAGKWPPQNPFSKEAFGSALMRGGGLGIYGDLLFGAKMKYHQGFFEAASGPTIGTISDTASIWQDALSGDPKAGKYLDLALQNTPFANLFYLRPALDTLFINSLKESTSPGYIARQQRSLKKRTGQEYFIPRTIGQALR